MLLCRIALVSALLTVSNGVRAAAEREGAKLLDCSGLPCARFQSELAPVKLLIDTGNAVSVLDLATAKAMNLELAPYKRANGEVVPGYQSGVLKGLKLRAQTIGDVTVLVVDMKAEMDRGAFPKSDGSLSYRAIQDRVLTLDFRGRRLTVGPATTSDCKDRCGSLSYPTFGPKGPPIVVSTGFEVNGVALSMQVDTLYSGTMLIFPNAVARARLSGESHSARVRNFPFTDGGVAMIEAQVQRESFLGHTLRSPAAVYFATEKVHTPGGLFDGTVGQALFKDRKITFDFKANRFWVS